LTTLEQVVTERFKGMGKKRGKKLIFVLGGGRSGKSRYALSRARLFSSRAFIATAMPIDGEMKRRIATHQEERGTSFHTVEEPYDLAAALTRLPSSTEVAVIDTLTVWFGNLLYKYGELSMQLHEINAFFEVLKTLPYVLIVVSNEIGLGIIPADAQSRRFRDMMGSINQRVAALADEAVFMVSGLPLKLKG